MIVGIVGSEEAKFTFEGKRKALELIEFLVDDPECTGVCSGGCHLGGIDIWAKELAKLFGRDMHEFLPVRRTWVQYKARNIRIAEMSDIVHCITVDRLPDGFTGMRHKLCYHCGSTDHVKSGGCWTMHYAIQHGKKGELHTVKNYP